MNKTMFLAGFLVVSGAAMPQTTNLDEHRDHETARAAVAAGERLSLSTILAGIEASHGGRILEIERDRLGGREIYEIELLNDNGRVIELKVDAADGEILDSEYED